MDDDNSLFRARLAIQTARIKAMADDVSLDESSVAFQALRKVYTSLKGVSAALDHFAKNGGQ